MKQPPLPPSSPELPFWNAYALEVVTFLTEEGYDVTREDEGDVFFEHEGLPCFIPTWEADRAYLRVVTAPFWPIEGEAERLQVYEAATYIHNHLRVGRILADDHEVLADVTPQEGAWRDVFYRHLRALQAVVASFAEQHGGAAESRMKPQRHHGRQVPLHR